MKKKRVLVTGATGFIGSNLVRRLLTDVFDIHILVRETSSFWKIEDIKKHLTVHTVDLLEKKKLQRIIRKIKPHIIFHLANAGIYGGVHFPPEVTLETNFTGTVNLIEACTDIDYQCFVNTGSSAEYGVKKKPMKEDDICIPLSPYAVAKLAATSYGQYIGKIEKKPIVGFRIFSPFGPFDDPKRLITEVIVNALQNKPILLSQPNRVRDYIFIDDVLETYISVIDKAKKYNGEVFNIGSGRETSVKQLVNIIKRLTGTKSVIKWNVLQARSFESERWQADIAKTKKALDWKPEYSIEKGLQKAIDWFLSNYNLYKDKVRTFDI